MLPRAEELLPRELLSREPRECPREPLLRRGDVGDVGVNSEERDAPSGAVRPRLGDDLGLTAGRYEPQPPCAGTNPPNTGSRLSRCTVERLRWSGTASANSPPASAPVRIIAACAAACGCVDDRRWSGERLTAKAMPPELF